jgi:MFS superfamily sulfate permease-like transporter
MFTKIKSDLPARIVVFLVALPLCLGVALASGAPLLSGVISGIIGGMHDLSTGQVTYYSYTTFIEKQ